MKFPYGVSDFYSLRTEGYLYLDRTDRIGVVEDLGKSLLLLRPRRFGKSLWLATLACYYDLRYQDEHQLLFGDLSISSDPTPLAHRCFVLRWDFSEIDPDPPPRGVNAGVSSRIGRIGNEIHSYLNSSILSLLSDYGEHLPDLELRDDAFRSLDRLLDVIRQTPYRLYLLIDEYDNFANEVLTIDKVAYEKLVHSDGPFKYLFKWIKGAIGRKGIDRLFITGVSPLVMSDVTSGMNIAENVYLYPELNTLCGFTDDEVGTLLEALHDEADRPAWAIDGTRAMLREWYNGYRFALGAEGAIYNPTLVFYFLKHLQRTGNPPRQMLDANLAADESKLDYIAEVTAGQGSLGQDTVIDLIRKDEPLEVLQLRDRFTLRDLLERSSQDTSFLGAYLYYFGMLTLGKQQTPQQTLQLSVPNEVMHGLFVERFRATRYPVV